MTDEVVLRSAGPADVPGLLALWAAAGENRSRPEDRPDAVERLLAHDPDAVIVAHLEGRVVGSVVAGWDGWRAHLYRLVVDVDLRGQGLGRRLLAAAETRLERLGATRLDAMVLDDNETGRSLWAAAGYRPQPDWSRWVRAVER